MNNFNRPQRQNGPSRFNKYFHLSCPEGLEKQVQDELNGLGISKSFPRSGGVSFQISANKGLEVLLKTRVALKMYLQLANFTFKRDRDISKEVSKLNWPQIFNLNQTFNVFAATSSNASETFSDTFRLAKSFQSGILNQYKAQTIDTPRVKKDRADVSFVLKVNKGQNGMFQALVLMDLCGMPLSSRGYNLSLDKSAIPENLAAGILKKSGWNSKDETLVDIMCSSGTLLIEAALMSGDIPPAYVAIKDFLERNKSPWSFLNHNWYKQDIRIQVSFKKLLQDMNNEYRFSLENIGYGQFFGYDNDGSYLTETRKNLKNAGLANSTLELFRVKASQVRAPQASKGTLILIAPPVNNEDEEAVKKFYSDLGSNFKKHFKKYKVFILTDREDLAKNLHIEPKEVSLINDYGTKYKLLDFGCLN